MLAIPKKTINSLVRDAELGLWAVLDDQGNPLLAFVPDRYDEPNWRKKMRALTGLKELLPAEEAETLEEWNARHARKHAAP